MVNKLAILKTNLFLSLICCNLLSHEQSKPVKLLSEIISGYLAKIDHLASQDPDSQARTDDHEDNLRRLRLKMQKIQSAYTKRNIDSLLALLPADIHEAVRTAKHDFDTPVLDTRKDAKHFN